MAAEGKPGHPLDLVPVAAIEQCVGVGGVVLCLAPGNEFEGLLERLGYTGASLRGVRPSRLAGIEDAAALEPDEGYRRERRRPAQQNSLGCRLGRDLPGLERRAPGSGIG